MGLKRLTILFLLHSLTQTGNSSIQNQEPTPVSMLEDSHPAEVISLTEPDSSGSQTLHLRVADKDEILRLRPQSVFAPGFRILSPYSTSEGETVFEELQDEDDSKVEDLGDFYSVEDNPGSFFIKKENQNVIVDGILNDVLRISSANGEPRVIRIDPHTELLQQDAITVDHETNDPELRWIESQTQDNVSDTVFLEILTVMDYANSRALGFEKKEIKHYLGVFWNSVQKRFDDVESPKIKIVLTKVVIMKYPFQQPFLEKHLARSKVDVKHLIKKFSKWVYSVRDAVGKFDQAILLTGVDLRNSKNRDDTAGDAYVGSTCTIDDARKKAFNVAVVEDIAPIYSGVLNAAHKIGHLLNSSHDGEDASSGCSEDMFLMTSKNSLILSNWQFSNCSLNAISQYVRTSAKCLRDKPEERIPLLNQLPGSLITLNQQCQAVFGPSSEASQIGTPEVCRKLWCSIDKERLSSLGGAVEGSPCGNKKICLNGQCLQQRR